jgi:hypothetical protein
MKAEGFMTKEYRVEFAIEVDAETAEQAAKAAWLLLSGLDSRLPVADVIEVDGDGDSITVDLEELAKTVNG